MKSILLTAATCVSLTCFGAARDHRASELIKVTVPERGTMAHDLAYHFHRNGKVVACLTADSEVPKGTAQALLDKLPSDITAINPKTDQYSRIKSALNSDIRHVAVFIFEIQTQATAPCEDSLSPILYMRILNTTASHQSDLKKVLYCKLGNRCEPTVTYEEAGMAEEVCRSHGGLAEDELAFEFNPGSDILSKRTECTCICTVS